MQQESKTTSKDKFIFKRLMTRRLINYVYESNEELKMDDIIFYEVQSNRKMIMSLTKKKY